MRIDCLHCGKVMHVPECRAHLNHCSRKCYNASLLLDPDEIANMARRYDTRKAVAELLDIPYPTFMLKIKKQNLGHLFPSAGNYSRGGGW
jgi:hypothetical protein